MQPTGEAVRAFARLGLAAVLVSALALPTGTAQAEVPATGPSKGEAVKSPDGTVTLITGDRVTVQQGKVAVAPGKGRRSVDFMVTRHQDQLLVIPSDVRREISGGKLDLRLFDVAGLITAGYDDAKTKATPLLVTGRTSRAPLPKATAIQQIPAINGSALKVAKTDGAAFLAGLGTAKVWLDGKRHLTLDQSVPQIGAPAAWQAGYTGKGVKVAVLDTGIDATHPDLAGQIGAAKNFTEDPDGDQVGHGTHVASTIAGTAKASNGKYKGVAPDATLLDGKICGVDGCTDSAILAGMEWAATEQHAQIVNLSIGGLNTPEIDPVEAAVNRLTAETGTLFVIAAGNSALDGPNSIESPGSAEAALTVGAVDKQDQLAYFSSRGPSLDGSGLKPDVTAPGVGIVAAKAKDSIIGEPVGDQYLRLDGTSMATPHVAGAAALLVQQHSDWKAGQLKSVLMGSAKPMDGQNSFEQGAGRIDLSRAIHQDVVADPAGLSFGKASWPHTDDQPVAKQLTYRNASAQPVTLHLAMSFTTAAGEPAPAGALSISADTVTVPAKGSASVTVTSNTNHNGPDGAYSGRVTATAGDAQIVTPVGVDKDVESYTLTLNYRGPDGKLADWGFGLLIGLDNPTFLLPGAEGGTIQYRLPRGRYATDGFVDPEGTDDSYQMLKPNIVLDRDTTVDLDARLARQISATIDRPDADLSSAGIGYALSTAANGVSNSGFIHGRAFTAQLGEVAADTTLESQVIFQWGEAGADGEFVDSPYTYSSVNRLHHGYFTGFQRAVRERDLAKVVSTYRKQLTGQDRLVWHFGQTEGTDLTLAGAFPLRTRDTVVNFVEPGPVSWADWLEEGPPGASGPDAVTRQMGIGVTYALGRTHHEDWNTAPFVPSFPPNGGALIGTDGLGIAATGYSDSFPGRYGISQADTASTVLYRDGVKIAESPDFGVVRSDALPAGTAKYRLVSSATRPSIAELSTQTECVWTFTATAADEVKQLPLRTVRFRPELDFANTIARRPVLTIPFQLETQPGLTLPTAKKVELQVSGDDGKTWHRAGVVPAGKDSYRAIVATPKGAKYLSLKSRVTDADGTTADLTVLRAFGVRG